MRSMYGSTAARVWKRQPLAVLTSSTPRSFQDSRSSSSSRRTVSAPISSSNIFLSSPTATGSRAASSAASSTSFTSLGLSMHHPCHLHVYRRVRLRLGHLDQALAHELEHREEIDDQHGEAAPRLEQRPELDEGAVGQTPQDQGHVLAHRELVARDAVVLGHLRAHEQHAPGIL